MSFPDILYVQAVCRKNGSTTVVVVNSVLWNTGYAVHTSHLFFIFVTARRSSTSLYLPFTWGDTESIYRACHCPRRRIQYGIVSLRCPFHIPHRVVVIIIHSVHHPHCCRRGFCTHDRQMGYHIHTECNGVFAVIGKQFTILSTCKQWVTWNIPMRVWWDVSVLRFTFPHSFNHCGPVPVQVVIFFHPHVRLDLFRVFVNNSSYIIHLFSHVRESEDSYDIF